MTPRIHTLTKKTPVFHTSYIRDCRSVPLRRDVFQVVKSSKKASNNPGLCPVKDEQPGLSGRTTARNQFSSLPLSTDKNPLHCQMLDVHPAFYLFSYPLSYGVPVRERYGSTLLPATREQHDQNCTQSH